MNKSGSGNTETKNLATCGISLEKGATYPFNSPRNLKIQTGNLRNSCLIATHMQVPSSHKDNHRTGEAGILNNQ